MALKRTFVRLAGLLFVGAIAHAEAAEPAEEANRAAPAGKDLQTVVERQEERIRRLEAEIARMRSERTTDRTALEEEIEDYLADPDTGRESPPGSVGAGLFGGRVRLGGYFSLEFRDDGKGATMEFDQHRLVLKVQAEVAQGISFETEIEIEGGGADVGFLEDNEILVEYAELAFELFDDALGFKAGLLLVPWGRFNLYHDDPLQDLTDRPLVARRVAAVTFGQPGVGVEGTLELADGWFLDYDLVLVQGFAEGFSTSGGTRDARQSFRSDNNDNKQVFGRIVVSPPLSVVDVLEFGTSFHVGRHDDAGRLSNYGFAFDLFVKRGPFELIGEYMNMRIEQPAGAPDTDPRRMDGWFVEVAYHFFPSSWRRGHVLFTDESTFTLVVRVEGIDLNHRTSGSAFRDDLSQVTIGFNFRPVERTVFKISYTFVDSDQAGFESGSADRIVMSWSSYF